MKKICFVLALFVLLTLPSSFASTDVTIIINGEEILFNEESGYPFIDENGRTQVPFRRSLEAFGADVNWDNDRFVAIGEYENIVIEAPIGALHIKKNKDYFAIDSAATLVNNRTYLPIRAVFEGFGAEVKWNNALQSVEIIRDALTTPSFDKIHPYELGMTTEIIRSIHGQANEIIPSSYDYDWWLYYEEDYSQYYQLGVADDQLVAVYTPIALDSWHYNLTPNMSKAKAVEALDSLNLSEENYMIDVYYDTFESNRVSSLLIQDKSFRTSQLSTKFTENMDEHIKSYEQQVFHITNANRYKFDLEPLVWNDDLAKVARGHSKDMADQNYFDHTNLKGESPFDRMKNSGLTYRKAAENIAAGQPTPIAVVETWMNSEGHRKNILSDIEELGVGIDYKADALYRIYYTQKFITQ